MSAEKPEKTEFMDGVYDGRVTHAMYPTALRTLCGKQPRATWVISGSMPTCPVCRETALKPAFRGTAPRTWWRGLRRVEA